MQPTLRAFFVVISSVALLSACGKKEPTVAQEAEQALPKEEQMPTPVAPQAPTAAVADETKSNADFEVWFKKVGSSRVDLQACKLEYSIVSPK